MAIVLENALLVDIDPIRVEPGNLRIDGGRIVQRDQQISRETTDEIVDCGGAVVLPGLVNGHAHLYSALAAGMPPPPQAPRNFVEILKYVWWRLDRALDVASIEMSGRIGALDALHCGTTTLIDHHASPNCIDCSLDYLEKGIAGVGPRAVLCYETTDRNGPAGRDAGVEENHRYLEKLRAEPGEHQHSGWSGPPCPPVRSDGGRGGPPHRFTHFPDAPPAEPSQQFAGMVGAHALFTLEDETLDQLAALAERFDTGVHIHVAEDLADERECREKHRISLIDRLAAHNLLRPKSVFAHGTHLDADAIAQINEVGLTLVHNPRSNMNNGVGYTPVASFRCPVMLGTDGIGGDMFTEAKHAWFKAADAHASLTPNDVIEMLATSARRASAALGVTLGKLEVNAAADIVLTDYRPATPLTSENLAGHFIYAMGSHQVASVIIAGVWALRDHAVQTCNEANTRRAAYDVAEQLWERMARIE